VWLIKPLREIVRAFFMYDEPRELWVMNCHYRICPSKNKTNNCLIHNAIVNCQEPKLALECP